MLVRVRLTLGHFSSRGRTHILSRLHGQSSPPAAYDTDPFVLGLRIKTGISAIFNGITHRHVEPPADRPWPPVLSQTRRRCKRAATTGRWRPAGSGRSSPAPGWRRQRRHRRWRADSHECYRGHSVASARGPFEAAKAAAFVEARTQRVVSKSVVGIEGTDLRGPHLIAAARSPHLTRCLDACASCSRP